jgi:hypothetical protein
MGHSRGFTRRLSGPTADVQDVIAGLDVAGLQEDRRVALQLGVVVDDGVTLCRRTMVHGTVSLSSGWSAPMIAQELATRGV